MSRLGGRHVGRRALLAMALSGVLAACGAAPDVELERAGVAVPLAAEPATVADEAVDPAPAEAEAEAEPAVAADAPAPSPEAPPPEQPPPAVRGVVEAGFTPFATVEHLVLVHPAAHVERIGFHQAGHDGARRMEATPSAAAPIVLGSRNRGTDLQTAADIVVPPDAEIRAPVTGTVTRAGSYALYCHHRDHYAVIEPDARPGWEVKVLHVVDVQVQAGQRVEAGTTVLAPHARMLPFDSQVDEHTAAPAWPHVHVEVVDPSIPNRPSPGGGSSC